MISLEECRKIAPKLAHLSDEELLRVRDLLYEHGFLFLESFLEDKGVPKDVEFPRGVNWTRPEQKPVQE